MKYCIYCGACKEDCPCTPSPTNFCEHCDDCKYCALCALAPLCDADSAVGGVLGKVASLLLSSTPKDQAETVDAELEKKHAFIPPQFQTEPPEVPPSSTKAPNAPLANDKKEESRQ